MESEVTDIESGVGRADGKPKVRHTCKLLIRLTVRVSIVWTEILSGSRKCSRVCIISVTVRDSVSVGVGVRMGGCIRDSSFFLNMNTCQAATMQGLQLL